MLKHHAISFHNADNIFTVLDQFNIPISHLQLTTLLNKINFWLTIFRLNQCLNLIALFPQTHHNHKWYKHQLTGPLHFLWDMPVPFSYVPSYYDTNGIWNFKQFDWQSLSPVWATFCQSQFKVLYMCVGAQSAMIISPLTSIIEEPIKWYDIEMIKILSKVETAYLNKCSWSWWASADSPPTCKGVKVFNVNCPLFNCLYCWRDIYLGIMGYPLANCTCALTPVTETGIFQKHWANAMALHALTTHRATYGTGLWHCVGGNVFIFHRKDFQLYMPSQCISYFLKATQHIRD